jgi:23S rRNA (uracil1939-C5)-methyltransferase
MAMTAPGDVVTGRITAEHGNWAEAELVELNEASPLRTEPLCPWYGSCGGCSLQHIRYEAQLELKKTILTETLIRIGGVSGERFSDSAFFTTAYAEPWEYRNRVSLHTTETLTGFKSRKSSDIVPVRDCPVADPVIRGCLKNASEYGWTGALSAQSRFTLYAKDGLLLSERGTRHGRIVLAGKELTVDAGLFFQSNAAMLEQLLAALPALAVPSLLPMADLYSGVGTFSLFLADRFGGAELLEQSPAALQTARENLAAVPVPVRYYAGPDGGWSLRRLSSWAFAVADPPRRGMAPSAAELLVHAGPPVFAYISCEPATLARDCRLLSHAYELEKVTFFDFYPQTAHIETLAVFCRK